MLADTYPQIRAKFYMLMDGIESVLRELAGSFNLAIVTNGITDLQMRKFRAAGLEEFTDICVTSGEVGIGKPDPRIFEEALQRVSTPRHRAVMVGDTLVTDILGARNAGILSVYVSSRTLDDYINPDHIIPHLKELPNKIMEI